MAAVIPGASAPDTRMRIWRATESVTINRACDCGRHACDAGQDRHHRC